MQKQKIQPDLVLFDPPYTRNQVKEVYNNIGRHYGIQDTQEHSTNWRKERDIINQILAPHGIVISFGHNSNGMGKTRQYAPIEILLVNHGGAHNDTIVIVEKRI